MSYQADPQHTITDEQRIGHSNTIDLVTQQSNERFAGRGMVISEWKDNQYTFTDTPSFEMITNNTRFGKTNATEPTYGNRSGFKTKFENEKKFDKWDASLAGALQNPQSAQLENFRRAINRKLDDITIAALTGTAYGGDFPHVTPIAFPAGNIVAVNYDPQGIDEGGSLGLTPGKIFEAKRLAMSAEVDEDEELFLGLGPTQVTNLLNYSTVYKNEVAAKAIAEWGNDMSKPLFGMHTVMSNRLPIVTATQVRTCIVWSKRALGLAPMELQKFLERSPGDKFNIIMAQYGLAGAMRLKDELVYEILCDEDSTAGSATTY